MKATFIERLFSFIIDSFIVSIIFSLICMGISTNQSNTEKLMSELDTKLIENTITPEEYIDEYKGLLYDYQKENIMTAGVSIALTIAYYIVFQYMNKGQTLGKKLMRLKVVDQNTEKPISIFKGLLRSLLIYNVLSGIICIPLLYLVKENMYFIVYITLLSIEMLFIIISAIFILYRKDKKGLHDILTNTMVIKE